ncbi:MAG: ATP synthase F1 subunit gamma [Tannerellaceae bacterium]
MASLKEIKIRIASIQNTQKITSAMKMVSSAKLHHAQQVVEPMRMYKEQLTDMLSGVLRLESDTVQPCTQAREVKQVAIVACSSNTGLCGAFNANIGRELSTRIHRLEANNIVVRLYPVGKKIDDELQRAGYRTDNRFVGIGDAPAYADAARLATTLMELFLAGETDRVELLYHHFKSRAVQTVCTQTLLPLTLPASATVGVATDYLVEPSADELLHRLLPQMLKLALYTALLDTSTAEHAARMLAMQTADDNANDLIRQLTLQYNKTRQQAITNELLDIMGGAGRQ